MSRLEFMTQLKKHLQRLPYDEIKSAVDYYEEYLDEADPQNEESAIAELGSPASVASQIIANFAVKDYESKDREDDYKKSPKKGLSIVWTVILAVFAAPIALPLAIAVAVIALSLLITLYAIIISFGATAFALLLSGIICVFVCFTLVLENIGMFLFVIGTGFVCLGLGVLFAKLTAILSKISFNGLASILGKFILRRLKKNENYS